VSLFLLWRLFRGHGHGGVEGGDGRAGLIHISASASSASFRHQSSCLIRMARLWL
jgi:hypothetical protein